MKDNIKYYRYLLMFGHLCADLNQGALPAILPFLIASRNMSYASAAGLVLALNFVSSIVQPLLGYWGDKVFLPWLMGLGIALAGSGIALIGICESYWAIWVSAAVAGIGIAMFHPEGGKTANMFAGEKKGAGIGVFAVGGNLGFALGPIIASAALNMWGLPGTLVFMLPAYIMGAIIMTVLVPKLKSDAPSADKKKAVKTENLQTDDWNAFVRISSLVFCRSIIAFGLMTFIPLYWISEFSLPKDAANFRLTVFSLSAAAATLIGGRIADRYGFRRIICASYYFLAPLLLILVQVKHNIAATLMIIPIAFATHSSFSAMIAMGQSFLPNHIGFASGISLGLAVSIGGVCAPVIGWIGDKYGLLAAMYTVTFFAFMAMLLTFMIPKPTGENALNKSSAKQV